MGCNFEDSLKDITEEQFMEAYEQHVKWLNGDSTGKRLELYNVKMQHIDVYCPNLEKAIISNCFFRCCSFKADFTEGELNNVTFHNCNFSNSSFQKAKISDCSFCRNCFLLLSFNEARLERTMFDMSTFCSNNFDLTLFKEAVFSQCTCTFAIFTDTEFNGCIFKYSLFTNNNIEENTIFNSCRFIGTSTFNLSCPETGLFIGFKKAYTRVKLFNNEGILIKDCAYPVIIKLLIPEDAKRSSADSRKCRCDKAKVLSITSIDGKTEYQKAFSDYDNAFVYKVGKEISVDNFDDNRWNECAPGIHFFITRQEAIDY